MAQTVLQQVLILAAMMMLGFLLGKLGKVERKGADLLSMLLLDVFFPVIFWRRPAGISAICRFLRSLRSHWLMFYQERYVNMQDKSSAAAYASDEGTEEIVIPLRPHHGMCLAYFKGEGYSNGFTAHMAEMLKIFLEGKKIRLHVDTDEICSACPNNLGGHCETGDKVAEYDNAVLEKCGLKAGQTLHFSEFTKKVPGKNPCGR